MSNGLVYKIRKSNGLGAEGLWKRVTLEKDAKIIDLLYLGTDILDAYKSIPFKDGIKIYLEVGKIDVSKEMERSIRLISQRYQASKKQTNENLI